MKRVLEAAVFMGLGAIMGALAQAAGQIEQDRQARQEFCVPLYDQPGIERVQCDPIDGAK